MIGVADSFRIATAAVHRDSSTLDLIPIGFATGNNDNRIATLREIVFPSLFELGSKQLYKTVHGIYPGVRKIVGRREMKQCHKR